MEQFKNGECQNNKFIFLYKYIHVQIFVRINKLNLFLNSLIQQKYQRIHQLFKLFAISCHPILIKYTIFNFNKQSQSSKQNNLELILNRMIIIFAIFQIIQAAETIFSDSFQSSPPQWTSDPLGRKNSTSAQIVDCPSKPNQKCVNFISVSFGGDYFSKPITVDSQQDVVVQFSYLTRSNKQGYYSGLCVGWTDTSQTGFSWAANGYPAPTNDSQLYPNAIPWGSYDTTRPQIISDLADGWKIVVFTIPKASLQIVAKQQGSNQIKINLVMQHYNGPLFLSDIGAYYVTDFTVYYPGNCSSGCSTCNTFYDCTSCQTNYKYLNGQCIPSSCSDSLTNTIPYSKVTISNQQTSTQFTSTINIPGFDFNRCWYTQWVGLNHSTGAFSQLSYSVNQGDSSSAVMKLDKSTIQQADCIQDAQGYQCLFLVQILYNEQTLYKANYPYYITFNGTASSSLTLQNLLFNIPALAIPINSTVVFCQDYITCYDKSTKINITLNSRFYVRLSVEDSNLKQNKLTQGYVKLYGNGTNVNLTIIEYNNSVPGNITYFVQLNIVGYSGVNLAVTAGIGSSGQSRRRVLQSDDGIDRIGYGNITNITIKTRSKKLIIEENPEFGIILTMLIMIIL
ncbi:hypothetical protein pb186bvf_006889 [Paramecium bursaria]